MRVREHGVPHFHAEYGEFQASVSFHETQPRVLEGGLPLRLRRRVLKWAALHRTDLLARWAQRGRGEQPDWIGEE